MRSEMGPSNPGVARGGRCFIIDHQARPALYTMIAWASQPPRTASPAHAVADSATAAIADRRMPRPLYAQINLSALKANLARAREKAPGAQVLAVVKANAYGHGLTRVLPALASADGFALVELDAAVRLRDQGERRPILLIEGFFETGELDQFAAHSLASVVHCREQVEMLERSRLPHRIDV